MKAIISGATPLAHQLLQVLLTRHCPELQVVDDHDAEHCVEVRFLVYEGDAPVPASAAAQGIADVTLSIGREEANGQVKLALLSISSSGPVSQGLSAILQKIPFAPLCLEALTSSTAKGQEVAGKLRIPQKCGDLYCVVSDIIRLESDGSYSTVYLANGKRYVVSKGLKVYESLLPGTDFFRVHRSHLVNMRRIRRHPQTPHDLLEMEDGKVIEVARRKKELFRKVMSAITRTE